MRCVVSLILFCPALVFPSQTFFPWAMDSCDSVALYGASDPEVWEKARRTWAQTHMVRYEEAKLAEEWLVIQLEKRELVRKRLKSVEVPDSIEETKSGAFVKELLAAREPTTEEDTKILLGIVMARADLYGVRAEIARAFADMIPAQTIDRAERNLEAVYTRLATEYHDTERKRNNDRIYSGEQSRVDHLFEGQNTEEMREVGLKAAQNAILSNESDELPNAARSELIYELQFREMMEYTTSHFFLQRYAILVARYFDLPIE